MAKSILTDLPFISKKCSKCGIVKPFKDYYRVKSGYYSRCKACQRICTRESTRRRSDPGYAGERESRSLVKARRSMPVPEGHKLCLKCDVVKVETDFNTHRSCSDGRRYVCRECSSKAMMHWYAENRERELINHKEHYRKNKAAYHASNRQWRIDNHAALLEQVRKRRKRNRVADGKKRRAWYRANLERCRRNAHMQGQRRRAKLAQVKSDLSREQWEQIKAFYKYRCALCKEKTKLTMDHIVPLSKGGEHTASNIMPLCGRCNSSKGVGEVSQTYQPHLLMI